MNQQQEIFNDCISFLSIQGLDRPVLYCKVAKTKCAVGYLYGKLFGDEELSKAEYTDVILALAKHYKVISVGFFWDLAKMHDDAIEHKLPLEITAEQFALKYGLEYNDNIRVEEEDEPYSELPFPCAA